jgi:hypothetical protein
MFKNNTARYISIFGEIAEELMPGRLKQVDPDEVLQVLLRKSESDSKTFSKSREALIGKFKIQPPNKTMSRFPFPSIKTMTWPLYMVRTPR